MTMGTVTALHVRIGVRGELPSAVREELDGFVESPAAGARLLWGTVPDMASLLGFLERLHMAGVAVEDVERLLPRQPNGAPSATARIQVEGYVADYLAPEFGAASLDEAVCTTLEVAVADQDALFAVLARLEELALEVREVHLRPDGPQTTA